MAGVCVTACVSDTSMNVCMIALSMRSLERAVAAVKYRTLFNLMLQSLAGFLSALSANYKPTTQITLLLSPLTCLCFPPSFPL